MIDEIRALAIFAETIRQGSFRGAARKLGLSPSSVSYNIAELEKRLGTALIYRSTRKLVLTADGERLFDHAANMSEAADKALQCLLRSDGSLRGSLCVSATTVLMDGPLTAVLGEFAKAHPDLSLCIRYSDQRTDLLADGVDVVFRAGMLEDSSLKSRRIGMIERKLVCTPAYLQSRNVPLHPDTLSDWDWIQLEMMPHMRTFLSPEGERIAVGYDPVLTVNSVQAMVRFCLQGFGLCTPPDFLVEDALAKGELVALLPDYEAEAMPLYLVWPEAEVNLRATRALIDFVVERL
ncbi:MAG: LysR family transcriptional regulator [Cohaesibacter sp.]|nr:LysR family transcriptional regulator [Cohaesibacter sp.]